MKLRHRLTTALILFAACAALVSGAVVVAVAGGPPIPKDLTPIRTDRPLDAEPAASPTSEAISSALPAEPLSERSVAATPAPAADPSDGDSGPSTDSGPPSSSGSASAPRSTERQNAERQASRPRKHNGDKADDDADRDEDHEVVTPRVREDDLGGDERKSKRDGVRSRSVQSDRERSRKRDGLRHGRGRQKPTGREHSQ